MPYRRGVPTPLPAAGGGRASTLASLSADSPPADSGSEAAGAGRGGPPGRRPAQAMLTKYILPPLLTLIFLVVLIRDNWSYDRAAESALGILGGEVAAPDEAFLLRPKVAPPPAAAPHPRSWPRPLPLMLARWPARCWLAGSSWPSICHRCYLNNAGAAEAAGHGGAAGQGRPGRCAGRCPVAAPIAALGWGAGCSAGVSSSCRAPRAPFAPGRVTGTAVCQAGPHA